MASKIKHHVCFTVGSSVPWEKAILFGNLIAEPPIVLDYLEKTNGSLLPTGPSLPERDWWDEGPLTERAKSYRAILAARRHGLRAKELDELSSGKIPDLLTYKGFNGSRTLRGLGGSNSRHEFYEIKPRSERGIIKGLEKVKWLKNAYSGKGLPYRAGSLYTAHFYPPSGIVELPMLMMDKRHLKDWTRALNIIKKRASLSRADLSLEVRPAPLIDGLLLYRICVETETDDERRKDSKVIQTARELVNAFVMSALAGKPRLLIHEISAVARALDPVMLDGPAGRNESFVPGNLPPVEFPMLQVDLVNGPDLLRRSLPALRDDVNTRRIGLPGDQLMLCCDEAFWQSVIVPSSLQLQLFHLLRQTPIRWAAYARERPGFGLRDMVLEAVEVYDFASSALTAGFKPLVAWAAKNPGEAVLIGVGVVAVSALAFWALPALAAELAALEAASLATTSGAISGTFIETAAMSTALMEEATALELATLAQINLDAAILGAAADATSIAVIEAEAAAVASATAIPAGATGGTVLATAEVTLLRQAVGATGRRVVLESLKPGAPVVVPGGIGVTLMLAVRTAFAAPPGRVRGGPVPPPEAFTKVIGSHACGLYALRPAPRPATPFPGGSPVTRTPNMGERIDAAKFSPDAAAQLALRGANEYPCIYLGELLLR